MSLVQKNWSADVMAALDLVREEVGSSGLCDFGVVEEFKPIGDLAR